MKERNQYLENDGLYFESDTHEWFNDNSSTNYARTNSNAGNDALPEIMCFVVRNKETGEYDRVIMHMKNQQLIYDTKSLETLGYKIDQWKVMKRYDINPFSATEATPTKIPNDNSNWSPYNNIDSLL